MPAKIGTIPNQVNDPGTMLEQGFYLVTCEKVEDGDHEGQFLYDASFRVEQPTECRGQVHFERWFIGSDEDPEAVRPETWTQNAGRMKKCCEAMGIPFTGQNPNVVVQQMFGKQVCMKVTHKTSVSKKDGKTYTNARVTQYGQPGTITPEVFTSDNGQPAGRQQIQPPAAQPAFGVGATTPPPVGMPPSPVQQGGTPPVNPPLPPQYQ